MTGFIIEAGRSTTHTDCEVDGMLELISIRPDDDNSVPSKVYLHCDHGSTIAYNARTSVYNTVTRSSRIWEDSKTRPTSTTHDIQIKLLRCFPFFWLELLLTC